MRIISKKILALTLIFFNVFLSFAMPPEPGDCDGLPCQGDVPIDQNIFILTAAGLLLGVYIVYKSISIKKSPK
ncbi:hypothetical protein GON26_03925 [Flavobacterium sp. GA093]|uniref:Signal peptidase n=1 Tax=Flavobacterium hydrocarbonoxydans TaxID=2683249 RepID=A0A6I4NQQ1_9FLAO|nr:hypothetical protein [Flavobacterium hydrocarbonoxydans]MWB93494.1 hypothetical protein [Flavobacterium hydrocarbonoxydans]